MAQKAALYIRVSTVYQVDKDSLPMQKQDLINYCKIILGIDDYEIFEDAGYSAKNTDRPAFQNMMSRIRNNEFTHVIVWKLDRISRNIADFAIMWNEFEELGVQFVSKNDNFQTDTPMGRAMLNIIMTFAQLEREMTSMRVKATMITRAEQGKWNGANVPLGYKFDYESKYPVIDSTEAELIKLIFNKYEEMKSTTKLSKYLNENGYRTKRNGIWSCKTINQILRNPFYKGTLRYNYRKSARGKINPENEWIILENNHEAIISNEQWDRVQEILNKNITRQFGQHNEKHEHIFSGLLQCQKCGGGYSSYLDRTRNDGFRPSLYRCTNTTHGRNCDSSGNISDMILGEFILNYMSNILSLQKGYDKDTIEERLLAGKVFEDIAYIEQNGLDDLMSMLDDKYIPNDIEGSVEKTDESLALVQRKAKLERALKRLDNLYLFSDDDMGEKDYLAKKTPLINELNSIDMQIKLCTKKVNKQKALMVNNNQLDKCILDWKLGSGEYINYKKLAKGIDKTVLKEFFNIVIERVVIGENKRICSIKFKNGLTHEFLYR